MKTCHLPAAQKYFPRGNGASQRGAVMAMLAIALVVMVGVVGLALDGGHSTLSLTRLQNTLDAAALSAAKTLDQTGGDTIVAHVAALSMFSTNAGSAGNSEIQDAYNGGDIQLIVEFSNTLDPFVSGSAPAQYVRVRANNFTLPGWFIPVMGIDEIEVATSAVAGPSPSLVHICNIAPLMVCGDPVAGAPYFGFAPGMPQVLKASNPNDGSTPGPGNFQLVRLDGSNGGADIRRALAGDFSACVDLGDQVDTEPGNTVGPSIQGINTRMGQFSGPLSNAQAQYPPDVVVTGVQPALQLAADGVTVTYQGNTITTPAEAIAAGYYDYASYSADVAAHNYNYNPLDGDPPGIGAYGRRTMAVPVGDCTGAGGGQQSLPMLGVLCYHLLQTVSVQGGGQGGGNGARIFGEFVGDGCGVTGNPGDTPNAGPGPHVIQLYKDPDAVSS